MSVRRRQYRNADGQWVKAKSRWTISFMYKGRVYSKGGFLTKEAAEVDERDWRNMLARGEVRIEGKGKATTAIEALIVQYTKYLTTLQRDDKYVYVTGKRLRRMARMAGWRKLRDITEHGFEVWRGVAAKQKVLGRLPTAKTLNQYQDTLFAFLKWCVRPMKLLPMNPLAGTPQVVEIDNEGYRRAGTVEEFDKLIRAVDGERGRFYLFAIYAPLLRRDALEHLVWGDVHEQDPQPYVMVRGETNKNRKNVRVPLRREIAGMLSQHRNNDKPKPTDRVFVVPTIDEMKADYAKAGIQFELAKNKGRLDLHAFRKTVLKWMELAGVSLREASQTIGHRQQSTTEKHYRERIDATAAPVERLPWVAGGER